MGTSLKDRLPPEYVQETASGDVFLYRVGALSMSVCAPGDEAGAVAVAVNRRHPTGLSHGWSVSTDTHFRCGQPNPCTCEEDAGRKHWLLDC